MKKVLYLTVFANQFQQELVEKTNAKLAGFAELETYFIKSPPEFRAHWGKPSFGTVLPDRKPEREFQSILDSNSPDLVVMTPYRSALTRQGVRWAERNNRSFVLGPHEIIRPRNPAYDFIRYSRYLKIANSPACKAVITMGTNSVREISKRFKGPVYNIPYSFSLSRLLKSQPPSLANGLTFLYSGRLFEFRNPLLSIEMFAQLKAANRDKQLNLIMSGEGPLANQCNQLIIDLDLENNVTWMNDFEDWYDIHKIYSHAHVLLALQHFGTWGIIIQEAMAAGLGIVATPTIESAANLIVHRHNGFLVNLNKEVILDSMQKYVDDTTLWQTHGRRSKEIVCSIDIDQISTEFARVITSSLGQA